MVYGIIEVKTTLNKYELKDAFEKCANIRAMATTSDGKENKAYVLQLPPASNTSARYQGYRSPLPPRFFVFGYDGWRTMNALEKNFKKLSEEHPNAHIHGVCSLYEQDSLYIRHNAFKQGDDRFSNVDTNGFRIFLMNLPATLDSMLPAHRAGLGFDQIHLGHYALAVE